MRAVVEHALLQDEVGEAETFPERDVEQPVVQPRRRRDHHPAAEEPAVAHGDRGDAVLAPGPSVDSPAHRLVVPAHEGLGRGQHEGGPAAERLAHPLDVPHHPPGDAEAGDVDEVARLRLPIVADELDPPEVDDALGRTGQDARRPRRVRGTPERAPEVAARPARDEAERASVAARHAAARSSMRPSTTSLAVPSPPTATTRFAPARETSRASRTPCPAPFGEAAVEVADRASDGARDVVEVTAGAAAGAGRVDDEVGLHPPAAYSGAAGALARPSRCRTIRAIGTPVGQTGSQPWQAAQAASASRRERQLGAALAVEPEGGVEPERADGRRPPSRARSPTSHSPQRDARAGRLADGPSSGCVGTRPSEA